MAVRKNEEKNTWLCEIRYKDGFGINKRKKKTGFKTRKDALAYERDFLNKSFDDPEITFNNLYEHYMKDFEKRGKQSTIKSKKETFTTHILPYFGEMKIKDITPLTIREWQNKILENNYKQTYLRTINTKLVAILNHAVKFYKLKQNPCNLTSTLGSSKTETEMNIWSPNDFTKFIDCISSIAPKTAFLVLYGTGMRLGELFALTKQDIDLEKKIIKISKTFQKLDKKTEITTDPKTKSSVREILISNELTAVLSEYIQKIYDLTENQRLFTMSRHSLSNYINRYYERLGIPKIRLHDLRHSHASYLLHKNVNIATISKRLGHKNISTTLDVYSHFMPEANDYLIDVLNEKI